MPPSGPGPSAEPIEDFAIELEQEIDFLLRNDFHLTPIDDICISDAVIYEISHSSFRAMEDMRNQYRNSITLIKYISNVMFWIIKLKPVCGSALLHGGRLVNIHDINEQLAVWWGMKHFIAAAADGMLTEIIDPTPRNINRIERVIRAYVTRNLYRNRVTRREIPNTQKYTETLHYLRFKKFTSVNIYEMFLHLVVPYRSLGRN